MRYFLKVILLLFACFLIPASLIAGRSLPVDTHEFVEKKYAGWSGVLRAWVCSDWSCESSFVRWLNDCAADFEKTHNGVYIEFAFAEPEDMNHLYSDDVPPPEMIFFSPGVVSSAERLIPVGAGDEVRPGLQIDMRAVPVAMGGYICVRNPAAETQSFVIPEDDRRRYSEAATYIMEETPAQQPEPGDVPGIDLGLPALAQSGCAVSESAFDDFTAGKTARTIVTQKELARLIALNESGQGPQWSCEISGTRMLCDQLLLAGIPQTGVGRESAAQAFIRELLNEENQRALASIGAFGVTETIVYSDFSPYAPMESLLRTRTPMVPASFSSGARNS